MAIASVTVARRQQAICIAEIDIITIWLLHPGNTLMHCIIEKILYTIELSQYIFSGLILCQGIEKTPGRFIATTRN